MNKSALIHVGVVLVCVSWLFFLPKTGTLHWTCPSLAGILSILSLSSIRTGPYFKRMHRFLLGGFVLLFIGAGISALGHHGLAHAMHGFSLQAVDLLLDIAGMIMLTGVAMAAYKRYVAKAGRFENKAMDLILLAGMAFLLLSGFWLEATRIATSSSLPYFSVVGVVFAAPLLVAPVPVEHIHTCSTVLWYLHAICSFLFLAVLPWCKLSHIWALPLRLLFVLPLDTRTQAPLKTSSSASTSRDLPQRSLMEIDACMQCGRCRKRCPIFIADHTFSVKRLLDWAKLQANSACWTAITRPPQDILTAVWSCSGCRLCEEQCPMEGEHLAYISSLRRFLLANNEAPAAIVARFTARSIEQKQQPLPKDVNTTVYIWPGCDASISEAKSAVSILEGVLTQLDISYFRLSPPMCCAGTERLLGNNELFQCAREKNMGYLGMLPPGTIIVPCPHCYITLKESYPGLSSSFTILHHSEYLADLAQKKKLPRPILDSTIISYHDPCFLAHQAAGFTAPRAVLRAAEGIDLKEMKNSAAKRRCCGSGGGSVTTDSSAINAKQRIHLALDVGAQVLVTSCPYCKANLNTVATSEKLPLKTIDIMELFFHGEIK
ncbi:respiratory nitrate reductase subunit gamma [Desulfobulbus rhabdoformis]|uniref:heterodisulfide reductase-related iron-sulfur binding cluster n=1 Tax=Desulfobulbus rhabdoformis TaxID=34032 RepID=UPI00196506ED|nr:heterodisulfide reductase-related iron-sulfur binding cluster [Desulfobulbus rhabdoformis]MBM9616727.1 respiratory nitrate reductase subunit gamma [Desulfobulbus rhabdoformis]